MCVLLFHQFIQCVVLYELHIDNGDKVNVYIGMYPGHNNLVSRLDPLLWPLRLRPLSSSTGVKHSQVQNAVRIACKQIIGAERAINCICFETIADFGKFSGEIFTSGINFGSYSIKIIQKCTEVVVKIRTGNRLWERGIFAQKIHCFRVFDRIIETVGAILAGAFFEKNTVNSPI